MKIFVFLIFICFASSVFAIFDEAPVDNTAKNINRICRGLTHTVEMQDLDVLQQNNEFPTALDSDLRKIVQSVEDWNTKKPQTCKRNMFTPQAKEPHRAVMILDKLARKSTQVMIGDINFQSLRTQWGVQCLNHMVQIETAEKNTRDSVHKDNYDPESGDRFFTENDFSDFKGKKPSDKFCAFFYKDYVIPLRLRQKKLRQLMAVADGNFKNGAPLQHDKTFADELQLSFFPSIWKKNTSTALSPLDREELIRAQKLAAVFTKDEARAQYYQLISTTNVLLFFDKSPTTADLHKAYVEMDRQNQFDIKDFSKYPSIDVLTTEAYTAKALEQMPLEERGDACYLTRKIQSLVRIKEDALPVVTSVGVMALMLGSGGTAKVAEIAIKKAGQQFVNMSKGIGSGLLGGAVMSAPSLAKYQRAVKACSAVTMEQNTAPTLQGLCDFGKAQQVFEETQSMVLSSAVFGVGITIPGWYRILRAQK